MSAFDVSDEFLQEELGQTSQLSKKGGPYSKHDRKKRREEVLRLHYEYGMSATKIAEIMKVNRKTISNDIEFWNKQFNNRWEKTDIFSEIMKIIHRKEIQMTRLRMELDKQTTDQGKIAYEKLIMQCQSKIDDVWFRLSTTEKILVEYGVTMENQFMKEKDIPWRAYGMYEARGISKDAREKIDHILDEDKEKTGSYEFYDYGDSEEEE